MSDVERMSGQKRNRGKIVIVSGPSGVGKGTICREVVDRVADVCVSVSVTTRAKADTEVDGKDYWFVSKEEFERRIEHGLLLEYAEVFGHFYGTPSDKVEEMLENGKSVILEIDVQGGEQVKRKCPEATMIFILPPTGKELEERIINRGRDASESTRTRLDGAAGEIAVARQAYEYMVVNDDLEQAILEVIDIIGCGSGEKL